MTHPHAPPESTPSDAAFVRTFLTSFLFLVLLVAGLTILVDPLGRFGTGLIPPVVSNDRDQKATLYRSATPRPRIVVLGSSRSKTIAPACLQRLTGRSAFNFAVNGAGSEDFLAILRFLRAQPGDSVQALFIGVDPETMQGTGGVTRALTGSHLLAPYLPTHQVAEGGVTLGADLLGWQAVSAALRSLGSLGPRRPVSEVVLEPDGLQRYLKAEAELRTGTFPTAERVIGSIPGVLTRYEAFPALDSIRVSMLRQFVVEAKAAGLSVTAFIPPVHPALSRAAINTAWAPRTEETVALLRTLAQDGGIRYVETRALTVDSMQFVDAVHFLAPVADRVAEALTGTPGGCALQ